MPALLRSTQEVRYPIDPLESLKSLFLPWIRFSETPDDHRLETLKMLLSAVPGAGWQLLVGAYSSSHGLVTLRQPPSWRPWGQDGALKPTNGEYTAYVGEMEDLILWNVEVDADRWADLVEIISRLSSDVRRQAFGLLSQQTGTLRQHPDLDNLWTKLRKQLHPHNSYPNADWAMNKADLKALESVYQELAPSDPVAAYAWLFDSRPKLLNPPHVDLAQKPIDFSQRDNQVLEARQAAVRAAYERGWTPRDPGASGGCRSPESSGSCSLPLAWTLGWCLTWFGSTWDRQY